MFKRLTEQHYQQGCRDRQAGLLPRMPGDIYLRGYLQDRPGGLDEVVQYFPTVESYLKWKSKISEKR